MNALLYHYLIILEEVTMESVTEERDGGPTPSTPLQRDQNAGSVVSFAILVAMYEL